MRNTVYRTLYVLLLFLSLPACKKESDDTAQPTTTQNTKVTVENYNLITIGMSYTQVVSILGTGVQVNSTTYSWSADNTNSIVITLVFNNNTVQTRSQTGLASQSSGGTTGGSGTTTGGGCPSTHNGRTVYTGPRGGCYYINSNGNKVYI